MRPSVVLTVLSAGVLASAFPKELKRDQPACNGEVYDSLCCVNGEWAGEAISSAVTGFASSVTSFYSAHSSSIQGDLSTAASEGAAWVSSNSGSISSFLTSNSAALKSNFQSLKSTFTPPADPFNKRDASAAPQPIGTPIINRDLPNGVTPALITPPPTASVLKRSTINIERRSVSVVSQGLTCYGQAVVTLSASDASSLIASATSAASGTRYYANGSSGTSLPIATPTTSTSSTSTSTAGAAKNTMGPMLAVGGAAIAFAFAAM